MLPFESKYVIVKKLDDGENINLLSLIMVMSMFLHIRTRHKTKNIKLFIATKI